MLRTFGVGDKRVTPALARRRSVQAPSRRNPVPIAYLTETRLSSLRQLPRRPANHDRGRGALQLRAQELRGGPVHRAQPRNRRRLPLDHEVQLGQRFAQLPCVDINLYFPATTHAKCGTKMLVFPNRESFQGPGASPWLSFKTGAVRFRSFL